MTRSGRHATLSEPPEKSLLLPSWADTIPKNWSWHRLEDACTEIVDCPHSTPEIVDYGPYLMARTTRICWNCPSSGRNRRGSSLTR